MSTNNPVSGQEDVKKVPHDKQKIQGAEKYAMDHAHDGFYERMAKKMSGTNYKLPSEIEQRFFNKILKPQTKDWGIHPNQTIAIHEFIATEQVTLLKWMLGEIGEDEHVGLPTTAIQEERNNYKKQRNKLRAELRAKVEAKLQEYEV